MKSETIFEGLKDLAQKLGITVSEQNFRRLGVRAKSGFCIVKGKSMFFVDKKSAISEKIEVLSSYLATLPTDHIYIVPAIRQRLQSAQKGVQGDELILQPEDTK
jgi:AAA+ ATPase superfamily predicted ATPase